MSYTEIVRKRNWLTVYEKYPKNAIPERIKKGSPIIRQAGRGRLTLFDSPAVSRRKVRQTAFLRTMLVRLLRVVAASAVKTLILLAFAGNFVIS